MWKVRFFGIGFNEYEFLTSIKENVFSKNDISHGGGIFTEYYFNVDNHDQEAPANVLALAEEELKVYRSILNLSNYNCEIKVDHPVKIEGDGTETSYMFFYEKLSISCSFSASVNGVLHTSSEEEKKELAKQILENSLSNSKKKQILILISQDINWINAYKIYEIIRENYQGEKTLKSYKELKSFAHTANSPNAIGLENARHGVQSHQSPNEIAILEDSWRKLKELALEYIKADKLCKAGF